MSAAYECTRCKKRHRRDSKIGKAHMGTALVTGISSIPAEEYHADPAPEPSLSASIAHLLYSRSPKHAWTAHPRLNPDFAREHDGKFDIGTAVHALLLEAREVDEIIEVVDAPDWRTKDAREARDAAREGGKIPLLAKAVDDVREMYRAAVHQFIQVDVTPSLFIAGLPEQTLVWEEDGIYCRARLDWLRDDCTTIDDYKTTSASADPDRWIRTLFTIGADIQTAFYMRGVKKLTGVTPEMRYCVQETYPPYALSVVSLGPDILAVAEAKVENAVARWRECLATGDWPGYPRRVCSAELPAWVEAEYLTKTMREEIAA